MIRDEMQRCFEHSGCLLDFLIQYISNTVHYVVNGNVALHLLFFLPVELISALFACQARTLTAVSSGEQEKPQLGPAQIRSQSLQQGQELNLLPLPSDFTTRPSLLLPTGTVPRPLQTDLRSQQTGGKASGCFKVLWEIRRDRSFLFHSVMQQRGENHPRFPTEQLSLPSMLINLHPCSYQESLCFKAACVIY